MQSIFVYSITKQTDRFEIEQKVVYLQNLVQHVLKMSFYFFSTFSVMKRTSLMRCTAAMCFYHKPFVTFH